MSAEILLTPVYWSFGAVVNDSTTDKTAVISNTGSSDMTIGAMTGLSSPYSLLGDLSGTVIGIGTDASFAVRYTPTSNGATNQTLTINNDSTNYPAYEFGVDGTSTSAIISIDPTYWSFGAKTLDSSTEKVFRITNNGNVNLTVATGAMISPFYASGTWPSDATIAPAAYFDATVGYNPTTLNTGENDYIEIYSNDPDTPILQTFVDGTCQQAVFSVTPTFKSFGIGILNAIVDQTVSVSNSGNIDMTMATLGGLDLPFTLVNDTISGAVIAADGTNSVVVRYDATALGTYSDTLDMSSNDPSALTYGLNVDGTCQQAIIGIDPTYWSFGNKIKDSTTDKVFRISNTGNVNLTVATGAMILPFYASGIWPSDATIAPAEYFDATVSYIPTTLSTGSNDYIEISSNDPDTPILQTFVDGTCQQAIINVIPDYYSFGGGHLIDSTSSKVFRIDNSGNINLTVAATSMVLPFYATGTWPSDQTIAASGHFDATVLYIPNALSSGSSDYLGLTTNDPNAIDSRTYMDGTCQQPIVSVSPAYKYFGTKTPDSTTDQTVTVSNTGNLPLIMGTLSGLAYPFSMVGNNVSGKIITAGDSSTVVVRFNPALIGTYSDTLVMPSNDPVTASFSFLTDGTASGQDISISPTSYNFGSSPCGFVSDAIVTVTNLGDATLNMQALATSGIGGYSGPFTIINDYVSSQVIEASGSRTFTIRYNPTKKVNYTASVVIGSDDPDTPNYIFEITANGAGSRSAGRGRRAVGSHNDQLRDFIS